MRHVSTLRRALGQKADQHDYILTVQGRGYQFVAPVTGTRIRFPKGCRRGRACGSAGACPRGADDRRSGPGSLERSPGRRPCLSRIRDWRAKVAVPTPARLWKGVLVSAALFVVVIGIGAIIVFSRSAQGASGELPLVRQITYGPSSSFNPTWSPDGALDRLCVRSLREL